MGSLPSRHHAAVALYISGDLAVSTTPTLTALAVDALTPISLSMQWRCPPPSPMVDNFLSTSSSLSLSLSRPCTRHASGQVNEKHLLIYSLAVQLV